MRTLLALASAAVAVEASRPPAAAARPASATPRPPTRPRHRSVLAQGKRTVLAGARRRAAEGGGKIAGGDDRARNSTGDARSVPRAEVLASATWVRVHEEGPRGGDAVPETRRAASAASFVFRHDEGMADDCHNDARNATAESSPPTNSSTQTGVESEGKGEGVEYLITSGGFTDRDWRTFPVHAFPITAAVAARCGRWIDLTPPAAAEEAGCRGEDDGAAARERLYREATFLEADGGRNDTAADPWAAAARCGPAGRMGHQSVVHDGKLYVLGGLIYDEEQFSSKKETFRLEDAPFVYRLDLDEAFAAAFAARRGENDPEAETARRNAWGWQRIIPRVTPFPTMMDRFAGIGSAPSAMAGPSAAEILITTVNRGEMQGGLWSPTDGGHAKFVVYGGLRIAKLEYQGDVHGAPAKFVRGNGKPMSARKIVELPLGDAWAYDLVLNSWEKITNDYGRGVKSNVAEQKPTGVDAPAPTTKDDDDWWYDYDIKNGLYPRPRTAHAATVVGDELIIHGGMGWDEHTNDWDGSTDWETLDDMWILNLRTREWTRRWLSPPLVRSYHSLVGWSGTAAAGAHDEAVGVSPGPVVAAFGGYTMGLDVFSGEELAYVFDDLLVSHPPASLNDDNEPLSPWLKASVDYGAEMISTRYEHTAVLSKQGVLVVWGGSFRDTSRVKGVWMINIAGEHSAVNLAMAEADSLQSDYEKAITALHTLVLMIMFMSISITLLLALAQRYQELVQQTNNNAAGETFDSEDFGSDVPPRRNGLHPEIINTMPKNIYRVGENETGEGNLCPICLADYVEGDELRVLPCEHFMHATCLDAWLANNPSCPSCRYSLREFVDDRPMLQLRSLRSRLSNSSALARFLGQDHAEDGIEMSGTINEGSLSRDDVFDLRYAPSLALSGEEAVAESGEGDSQRNGNENPHARTAILDQIGSWRSRREIRRERWRLRLSEVRSNPRRSRLPMVNLDED